MYSFFARNAGSWSPGIRHAFGSCHRHQPRHRPTIESTSSDNSTSLPAFLYPPSRLMRMNHPMNVLISTLLLGTAIAGNAQTEGGASMFRGGPLHTGATSQPGPGRFGGYAWRFDSGSAMRSSPVVNGDHIYIGSSDGRLHCLGHDGKEVWHVDLGAAVASSPAIASGIVVAQTTSGRIAAVKAQDGKLVWSVSTGPALPLAWELTSGDYYVSSPTIAGAKVVVGSGDGALRALDLHTGHEIWKVQTGGRIRSSPAVANGRVIVGSFDGTVYAVDGEQTLALRHSRPRAKLGGLRLRSQVDSVISCSCRRNGLHRLARRLSLCSGPFHRCPAVEDRPQRIVGHHFAGRLRRRGLRR